MNSPNPEGWLALYYPTTAKQVPREDAIAHSLQKWVGLRKGNLDAFGLNRAPIGVNGSSCALCMHHYDPNGDDACQTCPITKVIGRRCDEDEGDEDGLSAPWFAWSECADPEPMIAVLERCLAGESK